MQPIKVLDTIVGGTVKVTWVNSGVIPSALRSLLFDKNETLVGSMDGVSSGNGFFYALHTIPNSAGFYANKWYATINANTYVTPQFLRALTYQVD